MNLNKLTLLLTVFGGAMAHKTTFNYTEIQLQGQCPKIRYITNFEMPRVVGWWYRVYNSLNIPLCLNNEGITMYAAQYDDTSINTEICCRSAANPDIAVCGRNIGSGPVRPTSNIGELLVDYNNNIYSAFVLDIEYDKFSLIYGCKPGPNGQGRDELIYVFGRVYELDDELEQRVRNVARNNGVDFSKAKRVKQGPSTPYTPGSKPCNRGV